MRPLERGQQRRMDVHDPPPVGAEQHLAAEAHVAREANQIDPRGIEPPHDLAFVIRFRSVLFRIERETLDPVIRSPPHDPRRRLVAHRERHLGGDFAPLAGRDDRFEVRSAAAGEYRKPFHTPTR